MNRIFGTTMTLAALMGVATLSVAQAQNAKPVSAKPAPSAAAKMTDTVGSVSGKPVTWQMLFDRMRADAKAASSPTGTNPDPIPFLVGQVVAEKVSKGVFGSGTTSVTVTQAEVLNAFKNNTPPALNQTLLNMLREMALAQAAANAGLKVDAAFLDNFITTLLKQLRTRNPAAKDQTDDQILAAQNFTRAKLRPLIRSQAIAMTLARRDAEKELGHSYSGADFTKVRHILIAIKPLGPEAKAEEKLKAEQEALDKIKAIAADIKGGKKKFEAAALELSDDPTVKQNSGQLGIIRRGQMVLGFDKAAFALKTGEISDPVKTEFGYHIIESQTAGADLKPEEWQPVVEGILQEKTSIYVNELTTKSKVVNNLRSQPQMGMMPQGGGGRSMPRPNAPR